MKHDVFLCIQSLASAGAERFVTELACNIDKTKFNPIVVVINALDESLPFYKQLELSNIKVESAGGGNFAKKIFALSKILKKYSPVLVHSNTNAVLYMLLAIKISMRNPVHIFTVHSMAHRIFDGLKKKIIKNQFKKKKIIPVAICDTVKQSLVESYDLNAEDIECVYNGVDTNKFKKEYLAANGDDLVRIINVGTLYHIKNHQLLIKAFARLYNENPNVRLTIVGDGVLRSELNTLCEELGVAKAVNFAGNKSNVEAFLNGADIYCTTSIVEGLPISVLEAEACHLPIVTTKAGGVVDIVIDGTNGFVVESTEDEVFRALKKLTGDKQLRDKMGVESRKIAESHNIEKCVDGYEKIYLKVLGETNG